MLGINTKTGLDACKEAESAQREYDAEVVAAGRTKQQLVNANGTPPLRLTEANV